YDGTDINGGYIYNIKPGQDFRIPLPAVYDTTPVFRETGDKTVDAGSEIRFTVEAESPVGKPLTYKAKNPPRGSGFDPESRTFIWRPEKNQVGEHVVAIEATDGALSRTQYIKVKVFPSTLVPKPQGPGGTDGNDAGGGQNSGESGDGGTPGGESGSGGDSPGGIEIPPVTPDIGERFTDLVEYDWARNAIYELADKNIIMGRGDRYAPGENITRADFVLLLTRAFNLTGEGEGFSDVPGGAYYENALKAAKASGIITGIGDNKFNPTGEITREDMMVIVARALEKLGVTLEDAPEDVLNEFVDAGEISDYAKSAVSLLIKNGLIKGNGNRINPKGRATRAEMAVLVHRILTIKDNS
ncbi:MAG: S-layer homology domain-containing protein, partial [Clostridiales bacterium]|nr:S-layer homology domain-containing protein [Clostridiales bacterium]